jgi:hypothetical protein
VPLPPALLHRGNALLQRCDALLQSLDKDDQGGRVRLEANSLEAWRKASRVVGVCKLNPICYAAVLSEMVFACQIASSSNSS